VPDKPHLILGGPPVYGVDPNIEGGGRGDVPKREFGFNDQLIRARFVRKVFTMVGIMLGGLSLFNVLFSVKKPTFSTSKNLVLNLVFPK
jgi:hypothetical protein